MPLLLKVGHNQPQGISPLVSLAVLEKIKNLEDFMKILPLQQNNGSPIAGNFTRLHNDNQEPVIAAATGDKEELLLKSTDHKRVPIIGTGSL